MNRFALYAPTPATIEHVNIRDEKHGDEVVSAIDVKLSMEVGNDVLNLFHPGLQSWVYCKSTNPPPPPPQAPLELEEPVALPDLRFPDMDVLRWKSELQGYTLVVDYGIGGKSLICLRDCKVNAFRLECKQGGTVRVTWRVQRSQPDERAIGKLSGLLKRDVEVSLTPSPETQSLLDESDAAEAGEPRAPAEATDEFIEQHAED